MRLINPACRCRPPTQAETLLWLEGRKAVAATATNASQPSPTPRGFVMDPNTGALKPAGLPPTQVLCLSFQLRACRFGLCRSGSAVCCHPFAFSLIASCSVHAFVEPGMQLRAAMQVSLPLFFGFSSQGSSMPFVSVAK